MEFSTLRCELGMRCRYTRASWILFAEQGGGGIILSVSATNAFVTYEATENICAINGRGSINVKAGLQGKTMNCSNSRSVPNVALASWSVTLREF